MKSVKDYIPHREPFLFVDEIRSCGPEGIVTQLRLDPVMDLYRGHYPGAPVTPGVILCEAVFQSAGIWVSARGEEEGKGEGLGGVPILTRINDARFKRMAMPGDVLTISVKPDRVQAGFHFMKGRIEDTAGDTVMTVDFAITLK